MASAVDSRLAYARLSAVATASRLPTANRASNNSYTTSWDTTEYNDANPKPFIWKADPDHIIAAQNRGFQTLESIH